MTDPHLGSGDRDASARSAYVDLAREPDFALGNTTVRPSSGEVLIDGQAVRLQPRVMQVLVALVRANCEVVSRDQLVTSCWAGIAVGDDSINRCIGQLRRVAETEAPGAFEIETLPRIGYRLTPGKKDPSGRSIRDPLQLAPADAIGDARRHADGGSSVLPKPADHHRSASLQWWLAGVVAAAFLAAMLLAILPRHGEPLPSVRSLAVLPIRNLTGDPSFDPVADKLTEDTALVIGRSGFVFVAPREATFAWKGKPANERLLGETLHVRHVVTASLRKSESGYRVSYQIVDTATGRIEDSQDVGQTTPDGSLAEHPLAMMLYENITGVMRRRWISEELAKTPDDHDPDNVEVRLEKAEGDNPGRNLVEVERLMATARTAISKDNALRIALDDSTCWYYAGLIDNRYFTSSQQRSAWAQTALNAAEEANEIRPAMTTPHSCRAEVFGMLERWDEGLAEARYVIANFPLTVVGYEALANLDLERGSFRDALKDFTELAVRSGENCGSELGEAGGCQGEVGLMHLFLGDNDAAISALRAQAVQEPKGPFAPFFLSAALQLSGSHEAAVASAALYRSLKADNRLWRMLSLSHAPAYLQQASVIRRALHDAGLDEPAVHAKN